MASRAQWAVTRVSRMVGLRSFGGADSGLGSRSAALPLHIVRQESTASTSAAPESPKSAALERLRSRIAEGPSFMEFVSGEAAYSIPAVQPKEKRRKPDWMKRTIPGGEKYTAIKAKLRELDLNTVCEEAKCPNIGECWGGGEHGTATATIMLLGDTCTRGCRFCAVKTSRTPPPPDPEEPEKVSKAIAAWGLDYVVLTSVDRDDLPDQGSGHFAETIRKLKQRQPSLLVEALVPDFQGVDEHIARVATSGLDVFAHNVETVAELQSTVRDRRANFKQSLHVLNYAKQVAPKGTLTKTSIMLGCGETPSQVVDTLKALRANDVDVVTFGQYMRPTKKHMAVSQYITPEGFADYQRIAEEMGFRYVASGAMVRSSYKAGEFFIKGMIDKDRQHATAAA